MDNVDAHGQAAARCGAQVRPSFASAGVRSPGWCLSVMATAEGTSDRHSGCAACQPRYA